MTKYKLNPEFAYKLGLININDIFYDLHNLPDNLTVNHGLNLSRLGLKKLPKNLTVKGDLDLYDNQLTELPEGLKVEGHLEVNSNKLTELPDDLYVGKNLFLEDNNFPPGYKVPKHIRNNMKGKIYY